MKQSPIRKARRAKVKTEIDRWRETVYVQLMDLDKRVGTIEALMKKFTYSPRSKELPTPEGF